MHSGTEPDFDFLIRRLLVDSQILQFIQEKKDLILDLSPLNRRKGTTHVVQD